MPGVAPDDIDAIVAQISAIYQEAETAVVRQISRHLQRYPGAPTASVGEPRLEAIGALRRSVEAIQAGLQADGSRALREGLASAWQLGTRSVLADIPRAWFARSGIGEAAEAARAVVPQTAAIEALATALVRDVGARVANILRDSLDAYRGAVAGAAARMLAGGQTRRQATQAAWSALVQRGVLGFTDRANRRWRLHSYVEMATRTAAVRAAVTGQDDRLASLGLELVYISDHTQECPLCRPWEGVVLHRAAGPTGTVTVEHALTDEPITVTVAGSIADARAAGLWHPNCRHSMSAYLPGVTRLPDPEYRPEQYEARMRQRYLERRIRQAKEEEAAALDGAARTAARRTVRARQTALRDLLDQHPYLKRLRYREQVGAGSTPPPDRRDDAATPLGPDVQPDLLGGAEAAPRATTGTRQTEPVEETPPAAATPGQMELGDAETDTVEADPAAMTGAQLEAALAALIAAGDYDSPRLAALMAETDRRDAAGADPTTTPPVDLLDGFTDDEIAERIGAAYAAEDYDEAARLEAELERRAEAAPAPAPVTVRAEDLAWYSDDRLAEMLADAVAEDRVADVPILEAVIAARLAVADEPPPLDVDRPEPETDAQRRRREREDAEYAEMVRLVEVEGYTWEAAAAQAQGRTVESVRREQFVASARTGQDDRRSFAQLAREQYRLEIERLYVEAETECRGVMLNAAGEAAAIDPMSLFSGPRSRVERYASEELKNWFDEHGRQTFGEFVEAIEQGRGPDGGRDFNR